MATKAKEVQEETKKPKKEKMYFRSLLNGLKTPVAGQDGNDATLIEYVRFTTVKEMYQGDPRKVGYLATDNKIAIERFSTDPNVQVITKKEYDEAMNVEKAEEPVAEEATDEEE